MEMFREVHPLVMLCSSNVMTADGSWREEMRKQMKEEKQDFVLHVGLLTLTFVSDPWHANADPIYNSRVLPLE